ncbi:MAG: hypothetical protein ACE37N_10915 [Pseudohongiellaceae bacterium]
MAAAARRQSLIARTWSMLGIPPALAGHKSPPGTGHPCLRLYAAMLLSSLAGVAPEQVAADSSAGAFHRPEVMAAELVAGACSRPRCDVPLSGATMFAQTDLQIRAGETFQYRVPGAGIHPGSLAAAVIEPRVEPSSAAIPPYQLMTGFALTVGFRSTCSCSTATLPKTSLWLPKGRGYQRALCHHADEFINAAQGTELIGDEGVNCQATHAGMARCQ